MRVLTVLFLLLITMSSFASEKSDSLKTKPYDPMEAVAEHIANSYSFDIVSWGKGDDKHSLEIPLPVIVFKDGHFHAFMSSHFDKKTHIAEDNGSFFLNAEKTIFNTDANSSIKKDIKGHILNSKPFDISLSRNVWSMWLAVAILLFLFLKMAKMYDGKPRKPRGIQAFLEPVVVYIKTDIVETQIPKDDVNRYMPYLLTVFFFIWLNNTMGLIPIFPGGSNVTGNISVTLVLAAITLFLQTFMGSKSYWKHTLTAPGIPFFVKIILVPVEVMGIFTKAFALMIRLMANMTAGHITVISLISLIFMTNSLFISPVSVGLSVGMFVLDVFFALLQAYIFTILSAVYIGMAVSKEEH